MYKIHQIYYSPETQAALDPGFIPLDNTDGRKDWREYWPIRQYFMQNTTNEGDLIGFLSPLFQQKTGLSAHDVYAHIVANPDNDVYLFSPYFHLIAWHPNVFIQGKYSHPGIELVLNEIMRYLGMEIKVEDTIMSSLDTVYCNYFIAKVEFWKSWLAICNLIYEMSEDASSNLGQLLNNNTRYIKGALPMKIFVIERIASLILNGTQKFKTKPVHIFKDMKYKSKKPLSFTEEMLALDAIKITYNKTNDTRYIDAFNVARMRLANHAGLIV